MKIKINLLCVCSVIYTQTCLAWDGPIPESVTQLPSNLPAEYAEYQDAISKAFPGSRILSPSEIMLDKKKMGGKLYNKVKASPGLIVGKFNDDNLEDFAALTRNLSK